MKRVVLVVGVVIITGCAGRVVDWAKTTVNQGTDMPDFTTIPRSNIRSLSIYDQFDVLAHFSALWLSDAVRTTYANLVAYKQGMNDEQKQRLLQQQRAEDEQFISFYLLGPYEDLLLEKEGMWCVFLDIDGSILQPVKIKKVTMSAEYRAFFGKLFNFFKISYLIKFNARDAAQKPLINATTKCISLVFRSVTKEGRLVWKIS